MVNETVSLGSVNALIKKVEGMDAGALKDIVSNLKAKDPNIVCFFGNVSNDKIVFVSGAGKDAVSKGVHAGQLVKKLLNYAQVTVVENRIWHKQVEKIFLN